MTDEETITLGLYCEEVMNNDIFNVVARQFDAQCFAHFMQTEPKHVREREGLYAQMRGFHDFLAHMTAIVAEKNAIIKKNAEPSPSEDALDEDID